MAGSERLTNSMVSSSVFMPRSYHEFPLSSTVQEGRCVESSSPLFLLTPNPAALNDLSTVSATACSLGR